MPALQVVAGRGREDVGGSAGVVEVAAAAAVACDSGRRERERSAIVVDACARCRVVGVDAGVGQGGAAVDGEAAPLCMPKEAR